MSYGSEGEDLRPFSGEEIVLTVGISAEILGQNNVLLSKMKVTEYLAELGLVIQLATVRKRLTNSTYRDFFSDGREPQRTGRGGVLLITFAEARLMFGVKSWTPIPSEVLELMKGH
jgi:hypothetical protein